MKSDIIDNLRFQKAKQNSVEFFYKDNGIHFYSNSFKNKKKTSSNKLIKSFRKDNI